MGAGNPLARSYDNDRYEPTTYFIDFTECGENREEWFKRMTEDENVFIDEDIDSDSSLNSWHNEMDHRIESFRWMFQDLPEPFVNWFHQPEKQFDDKLTAAYRETALILAENEDCMVIHAGGTHWHWSLAFIPTFKYEDIYDDLWDENIEKEDWHDARGGYDNRIQTLSEREYEKRLTKWRTTYEPFARWLWSVYQDSFSMRNGAWMSTSLKIIGDGFKFL